MKLGVHHIERYLESQETQSLSISVVRAIFLATQLIAEALRFKRIREKIASNPYGDVLLGFELIELQNSWGKFSNFIQPLKNNKSKVLTLDKIFENSFTSIKDAKEVVSLVKGKASEKLESSRHKKHKKVRK